MANGGGVASTGVWEVRPGVGSDSNGGGFDPSVASPGTDYSQQNSAQVVYTDLVIGATTTQLTSVLNPFTSAHVGNFLQITSGTNFTKNIYEVLSVSGVTATMSASVGSAAASSGHGNLGGALASLLPILTRDIGSNTQGNNGNTIYVTPGGASTPVTVTSPMNNYDLSYFIMIGYGTTRGDNGQATITTSSNINIFNQSNANMDWQFYNIRFTCTFAGASNSIIFDGGNPFMNIYFDNCYSSGEWLVYTGTSIEQFTAVNCEITGVAHSGNGGIGLRPICATFIGCYIHDNSGGMGVQLLGSNTGNATGRTTFIDCVIANNGTYGVQSPNPGKSLSSQGATLILYRCAIVNNSSDGINFVSSGTDYAPLVAMYNCIISQNGGWGINGGTSPYTNNQPATLVGKNNAFYSNTSGNYQNFPALVGEVDLTGDPFVNRATPNYNLNSTAGAGAACKAAGWDNVIVN